MARNKLKQHTGPEVRFQLACRRGVHVDQRVGRHDGGGRYIERMMVTQYATHPVAVPQPSSGEEPQEVECPSCGRLVRVRVASEGVAVWRRFRPSLLTATLGPLLALPCLLVPALRKLSESATGSSYSFGLIALGVVAVAVLLCLLVALLDGAPELHAVRTSDFKHLILPAAYEGV